MTKRIEIPTNCPVCDSKLELVTDQLFCRNSLCQAQVSGKLNHFAKVMKIKGLGPSTIEKLSLESILDIYYLDENEISEAIGAKLASKLFEEIQKSKGSNLATVLASFSIPLIGETAASKVASVVDKLEDISTEKCKEAGLGEKATANLMGWMNTEFKEIAEYLPFEFKQNNNNKSNASGELVCITGKLKSFKNKAEATVALEALGYQVTDNLTKSVSILIDESDKVSSKRTKAESYGITIIENLAEFLTI